jgi:hypothetical protein
MLPREPYRSTGKDGVFCYTFFKAIAKTINSPVSPKLHGPLLHCNHQLFHQDKEEYMKQVNIEGRENET